MMGNLHISTTSHIVSRIILGIIVISFLITGLGNYLISDREYAAKVNGQKVSRAQLEYAVQITHEQQQEIMGKKFAKLVANPDYMRQVYQQMLNQLIDGVLLAQYAGKLGLAIGDDQVKKAIFATPAFHTENKFDNEKFHFFIDERGLSSDEYAEIVREALLVQQLIRGIIGSNFLLPKETEKLLEEFFQNRYARLVTFSTAKFMKKGQSASEDELRASYQAQKNRYTLPEIFKVSYVQIDAKAIQEKTSIDKQEIHAWYVAHRDKFTTPARKRYSIIQNNNEQNIYDWLKELKKGADFATLARDHSSDHISAKKGGDIGWVSDGDSLNELMKRANLSKKGQITGVIKSLGDFLIVRLDDIQPKYVSPLHTVYGDVVAQVKREKIAHAYYALQKKVSKAARKDKKSLAAVEVATGIKAQKTGWFNRYNMPAALNHNAVKSVLFSRALLGNHREFSNSRMITLKDGRAMVIRITDYCPASIQPLEQVRARVDQEVRIQKATKQARVDAEKVLLALRENNDKGKEVLRTMGLNFSAVQLFDSEKQDDSLSKTIFTLPRPLKGKSSYGIGKNIKGDTVLIALDKVTTRSLDAKHRKIFLNHLYSWTTGMIFDALLSNRRTAAKIQIGEAA